MMNTNKFRSRYNISNLFLDGYHYDDLFVPPIPPLEEEVK